jgi:hypothetical protein
MSPDLAHQILQTLDVLVDHANYLLSIIEEHEIEVTDLAYREEVVNDLTTELARSMNEEDPVAVLEALRLYKAMESNQ